MNTPNSDTLQFYLHDLGFLLIERALDAQQTALHTKDGFDVGRAAAFYEIVSLMQQQADAFQLDYKTIGLAEIDPDRELL